MFFFHDESIFNCNEDQPAQWGVKGQHMFQPKSKGLQITVFDFVDEKQGHLALTENEYHYASKDDPAIPKQERQLLVYDETRAEDLTCITQFGLERCRQCVKI